MDKPEFFMENEMHKILWNFETQKDHPILVRRTELVLINKKKKTCKYILPFQWTILWKWKKAKR